VDRDGTISSLIARHWQASGDGDQEAEHDIYAPAAILDYPQSGERFRGRETIQAQRGSHPATRGFAVRRIAGHGALWVSECVITYDGVPTYSVSIMEFANEHVVHETQYFADPFEAAPDVLNWLSVSLRSDRERGSTGLAAQHGNKIPGDLTAPTPSARRPGGEVSLSAIAATRRPDRSGR
jgi:hypothetical protein